MKNARTVLKVQDATIFCGYCGRDNPAAKHEPEGRKAPAGSKAALPRAPIWVTGAIAGGVVTSVNFINYAYVKPPNADRFQGNMPFRTVSRFLAWWVVCALLVCLWRRLDALVALTVCCVVAGAFFIPNSGIGLGSGLPSHALPRAAHRSLRVQGGRHSPMNQAPA